MQPIVLSFLTDIATFLSATLNIVNLNGHDWGALVPSALPAGLSSWTH